MVPESRPPPPPPPPASSPSQQEAESAAETEQHHRHQWHRDEVNDYEEEEEAEEMEEEPVGDGNGGPAHHPAAPADDLFDIQTTVDPSYIISLIRSLLPSDERHDSAQGGDHGDDLSGRPKSDLAEEVVVSLSRNDTLNSKWDGVVSMQTENADYCQSPKSVATGDESRSAREEAWEESGCILWDLAANKSHAEFMVDNLILEVLLANLTTSDSVRITEISIGIIGNLACHEALMKKIISTNGLVEAIVDQLFVDDTPCLSETCRLLSLGLGSPERITWARALRPEHVLSRVLWVAENTLNPQLIEKSSSLLLAIVENQAEVVTILLPTLKNLGLISILVNLLSFEMSKLRSERLTERYPALDSVLRVIEAISTIDDLSQEMSSNRELFQMAVELVKLSDKIEVANSCITAAVLIANILTDSTDLALELSKDSLVLSCLLDLFPLTSDDFEARNAIWSILARLLIQVQVDEMSSSHLLPYISALMSKSDLIEDDLLDYPLETSSEKHDNSPDGSTRLNFRAIALKKMSSLLNVWIMVKDEDRDSSKENHVADDDVRRLLECCLKHTS